MVWGPQVDNRCLRGQQSFDQWTGARRTINFSRLVFFLSCPNMFPSYSSSLGWWLDCFSLPERPQPVLWHIYWTCVRHKKLKKPLSCDSCGGLELTLSSLCVSGYVSRGSSGLRFVGSSRWNKYYFTQKLFVLSQELCSWYLILIKCIDIGQCLYQESRLLWNDCVNYFGYPSFDYS